MVNMYMFEVTVNAEDEGLQEILDTLDDLSCELEIEHEDDNVLARGRLTKRALRYLDFLRSQTLDWQSTKFRIWETAA